jgi:adenylate cyclase
MGIEIERKFLVSGDGWRAAAHAVLPMAQGYINDSASIDSGAQQASVRVLCVGGLIDKRRHLVRHGDLLWEVDEFLGDNAGLVVAEVELDDAAQAIDLPEWVGAEVTDDVRYYNLALAAHPYTRWA